MNTLRARKANDALAIESHGGLHGTLYNSHIIIPQECCSCSDAFAEKHGILFAERSECDKSMKNKIMYVHGVRGRVCDVGENEWSK